MRAGHYRRLAIRRIRLSRKLSGIKERRCRMAYRVEPELALIPDWARRRAIGGLSTGKDFVWLRPGDARCLERLDRDCGGTPRTLEVEFRYCSQCGRPLVGKMRRGAGLQSRAAWLPICFPAANSALMRERTVDGES